MKTPNPLHLSVILAMGMALSLAWRTSTSRAGPEDDAAGLRRRVDEQAQRIEQLESDLQVKQLEMDGLTSELQNEQERHVMDVSRLHEELALVHERLERQRIETLTFRHALQSDLTQLLAQIGEPAVGPILALLEKSQAFSRRDVVSLLGGLGPKAGAALDVLRKIAASDAPDEQELAAAAAEAILAIEGR